MDTLQLRHMAQQISTIRSTAENLKSMVGDSFPAVEKNADRILASVKMLELNVTDVLELTENN